jgi:signal transduction histidine kinase/ActR/RegA family two-component response regulator
MGHGYAGDVSMRHDLEEERPRAREACDQIWTLLLDNSDDLDAFLTRLVGVIVEAVRADVGVIRLREGQMWRSRGAVGLDGEVESFSMPIGGEAAMKATTDGAIISSVPLDACGRSSAMREKGVRALYRVALVDEEHAADVLVGFLDDRKLGDADNQLLSVVAPRAANAVRTRTTMAALKEAIRSRDEVLSVVAHDLRNPLGVITLSATTLLQRLSDSSARRSVERIMRGAQRADRMVRDLLEISAMEMGRFSIESRRVEPADLILAALESQQSLAAEASVIIGTDLSPELPAIEADDERLLEVLENLIGNAVKFTAPGGTITVGATRQEDDILVWVKDSGSGIAADQLAHIFDRFWQARKVPRRGTGLGLTICKGIVEAHGGRIWAESAPNAGTTMFFTIPAKPARARAPETVPVANILLVDDRPENLLSLKAILERPEYRLVTATTGEEALGLALRETFSVALIDIAMPRMSGLEVAVHLKELERSRDIPIIFITAFGDDPQEIHRAYAAGGADYLVKPLDTEIVRKKVAVFVDLSRKRLGNGSGRPRLDSKH